MAASKEMTFPRQTLNGMAMKMAGEEVVLICPMIFNDRIVIQTGIDSPCYDHGWCYDKGGAAVIAALVWDPLTEAEPPGYKKRATSGIRVVP